MGDRRVPADSEAGRRRLVQPLGGIVLFVGVLALVALLFAGIGTVTGSGAGVVLPLSYPAGGWQPVCADASINGMSFNGNGPTLVGAPGTTSVSGPSNPLSVCVINATGDQRALAYLGSAPPTLLKLAIFVLVAWLLLVARRKGPFAPRVHRMLVVLGWLVIAGSAVASLAPHRAPCCAPLLVGCAVLTLARIMRAGSLMRDDLEGTV
jgi:hypothetical protein